MNIVELGAFVAVSRYLEYRRNTTPIERKRLAEQRRKARLERKIAKMENFATKLNRATDAINNSSAKIKSRFK